MSGGTKTGGAELLRCGDGEFEKSIQTMNLKSLLDTISLLQKEMGREQASFNSLSKQLATLNKNSRQYKQISKEMTTSQTRLTMLMNRSMKCFQQQGNQHVMSAPAPSVQRHNSNAESKDGGQGSGVQRRHSSIVSTAEADVIKTGFDSSTKTPNQGKKMPVILQPLVKNSKLPNHDGGVGDTSTKGASIANGVDNGNKSRPKDNGHSDTESTSLSLVSVNSDSKTQSTALPGPAPLGKNIATASVLTNGASSGYPVTKSSITHTSVPSSTKNAAVDPSATGDSAKNTSVLNFGVKNAVQNMERKSVVNMSTSQKVTNGASMKPGTPTSSVFVKPAGGTHKTIVSTAILGSKSVGSHVVSNTSSNPANSSAISKPVTSATNQGISSNSVPSKIPDPPAAPALKKVSQASKYSRPPIDEPVDPRTQMLNEIRSHKRSTENTAVEPKKITEPTELNLDINQGKKQNVVPKTVQQQKVVPVSAPEPKVIPESVQQQKVVPVSAPEPKVIPESIQQQKVVPVSAPEPKVVSVSKTVPVSVPQQKVVPMSMPQQKIVPASVPQQKVVSVSMPQQKVVPMSVPQQKIVPASEPQQKVVPVSMPQQKEIPLSMPQQKEIPLSMPQQKEVPVSVPQQKIIPASVPQHKIIPMSQEKEVPMSTKAASVEVNKPEQKLKKFVILDSKPVAEETANAEPIKSADNMVIVTQHIPAQPDTQGALHNEGEADDDPPTEEKFVSQMTFTHKPVKQPEIVKPKQKKVAAPTPASLPAPVAVVSKPVDARYEGHISPDEVRGVAVEDDENDVQQSRINLRDWDPSRLLADFYRVKLAKEDDDMSHTFVGMEGVMEKLPMNKKKSTLLKTWKRRFFRAKDGWLLYFETSNRDRPSDTVQLMGGRIDDLGNRILGIDDGRGRYLMVRCPTEKEYGQWKLALESQTVDNVKATYVRPLLLSPPNPQKKVILIDIGSCSIRAGILGQQASLPQMFFPSVVAVNKDTGDIKIGIEAYHPDVRKSSTLMKAVRPTSKVDKSETTFNVDTEVMPAVLEKIFSNLKVEPSEYWIMLSTPQNLADQLKAALFEIFIGQFHVKGLCMVMQSLLALYSYQKTSGILVDIGHRMEILPIYEGYVIDGGVTRQSYGGQKVADSLNNSLTENKYVFVTPVEQLIVRHVMEQSCYVAEDYEEVDRECTANPESCQSTVYLDQYNLPEDAHMSVTHDRSCYHSPEGFFNTELWGMDYPCVHNLIFKAIQFCPIDSRKQMYRSVYLSGGVTMLPGFAERLQKELVKLAPPSVIIEVHAAPQRYHAAYIGACSLANMDMFEQSCITGDEWARNGVKAFVKWAMK